MVHDSLNTDGGGSVQRPVQHNRFKKETNVSQVTASKAKRPLSDGT